MSIILTAEDALKIRTNDKDNVVIIDVRSKEAYVDAHIPGALFLDVKQGLTGKESFLPEPENLERTLSDLGINNEDAIIFYDDGNHRAASKALFVMKYLGHKNVYVLDGGFSSWLKAGNDSTKELPTITPATYKAHPQESLVLTIDQVKEKLLTDESTLIDSRSSKRYTGEVEPKYKKAGHIPGAKNFQSKQVFDEEGLWKKQDKLKQHFQLLNDTNEVVVSCGSGNSACMNFVALMEAGFTDVKLYPGGFSEWINDDTNEVHQGMDP